MFAMLVVVVEANLMDDGDVFLIELFVELISSAYLFGIPQYKY